MSGYYKHEYDERIIELRESGLTCIAVAEKLDIAYHTVQNCMLRLGLQGKFRGNRRDDKYIVKRPRKPNPGSPSPFSILVEGNYDFINIRLLPTSKEQAERLIVLLEKQGGEVISENGLNLSKNA